MILNAKGLPVWLADLSQPSLCPQCDGELIAKRGEYVVWHWAHRSRSHNRVCSTGGESAWHLQWKAAYLQFSSWSIEVKIGDYRVDAVNLRTRNVREFIHSLSPSYIDKADALAEMGYDVLWIFDGGEFVRWKVTCCGADYKGRSDFLKPKATEYYSALGGLVHHQNKLYREWRNGVFYPTQGSAAMAVLDAFNSVSRSSQQPTVN